MCRCLHDSRWFWGERKKNEICVPNECKISAAIGVAFCLRGWPSQLFYLENRRHFLRAFLRRDTQIPYARVETCLLGLANRFVRFAKHAAHNYPFTFICTFTNSNSGIHCVTFERCYKFFHRVHFKRIRTDGPALYCTRIINPKNRL